MTVVVAALYVEKGGVYFGLDGVDPWDEERDARTYAGPWPVVAHPPCQLWINYAALNFKRYGGEHNRPGNDSGCFAAALAAVRRWGGVLEHPASSNAWKAHGLTRPLKNGDWYNGDGTWVCEVWQSAYGHRARKRTWLLYVGANPPPDLDWSRKPGTHQVGWFDRIKPTLSKKAASSTPPAFRDLLLSIARASNPKDPTPRHTRHAPTAERRQTAAAVSDPAALEDELDDADSVMGVTFSNLAPPTEPRRQNPASSPALSRATTTGIAVTTSGDGGT